MIVINSIFIYPPRPIGRGLIRSKVQKIEEGEVVPMAGLSVRLASQSRLEILESVQADDFGEFTFNDLDESQLYFIYAHFPHDKEGRPMQSLAFGEGVPEYQAAIVDYIAPEVRDDYPPISGV